MRRFWNVTLAAAAAFVAAACSVEPADVVEPEVKPAARPGQLLVLCEGLWGMDNSCIASLEGGEVVNKWFQVNNPGRHLGDTGNDIILAADTLIAVSVNWSNIIQYVGLSGKAVAATEDIPNNRKMVSDGRRYLYCSSYARGGYVAKIDLRSFEVVGTCSVGREPEGMALYDGRLYVANTGGYAQTGGGEPETTVSVVDVETMTELRRIDTRCPNLFGKVSQAGRFLCVNSAGDYYDVAPKTVVIDMQTEAVSVFDFASTYSCARGDRFYTLGSAFSYSDGQGAVEAHTISLPGLEAADGLGDYQPAMEVIAQMQSPYGIYISPLTGHLYATDARAYTANGYLYEFDERGGQVGRWMLEGINPGHFLHLETTE